MAEMPSLPPTFAPSPSAPAELSLAREALETALVLDACLGDDAAFDRDAAQLAPYYADARGLLPDSAAEPLCASLALLRSLVAGRLAAFHADAARLPAAVAASPAVSRAVALEAWLAEGAYNKALEEGSAAAAAAGASGSSAPSSDPAAAATAHFLGQLLATVRAEVATCCEAAYASLAAGDAARLLRLEGQDSAAEKELAAIAQARGWRVRGGRVFFPREGGGEEEAAASSSCAAAAVAAPGPELIAQALAYARELERIV